MKIAQYLLAVVVLAGGASAHAAVYNITGSLTTWEFLAFDYPDITFPAGVPTFIGTVDDVTDVYSFTFTTSFTAHAVAWYGTFADITTTNQIISGIGNGSVTKTGTSDCVGAADVCAVIPLTQTFGGLTLVVSGANISGNLSTIQSVFGGVYSEVYTFNGTAVPTPAAVWLFGSGLIGLATVNRKRRAIR